MQVPMTDLVIQYENLKEEIDGAVHGVMSSGGFIMGPEVARFEEEMAAFCQAPYAIGVGSGTEALHLALRACGIGPGDEVITTPFTFFATTEAILHCGAKPVFVDVDPVTMNMDCDLIEPAITDRTKAVLPVHLYGHPVDMGRLMSVARAHKLQVVEDCAQALGAVYDGQQVGTFGHAGCFSFFPSKMLGAFGDGGMVITSDEEVAQRIDVLRKHGSREKYFHSEVGFNSRLDAIQAAVLRVKLRHLSSWIVQRRGLAAAYNRCLDSVPWIDAPTESPGSLHCYNYYTVRIKQSEIKRDDVQARLKENGIGSAIYYPLSLHLQPALRDLGHQAGDFPAAEAAQEEVLSLPMYPELEPPRVEEIAGVIAELSSASSPAGNRA